MGGKRKDGEVATEDFEWFAVSSSSILRGGRR